MCRSLATFSNNCIGKLIKHLPNFHSNPLPCSVSGNKKNSWEVITRPKTYTIKPKKLYFYPWQFMIYVHIQYLNVMQSTTNVDIFLTKVRSIPTLICMQYSMLHCSKCCLNGAAAILKLLEKDDIPGHLLTCNPRLPGCPVPRGQAHPCGRLPKYRTTLHTVYRNGQ